MNESGISRSVFPGCSVYPGYPETSEGSFFKSSVSVSMYETFFNMVSGFVPVESGNVFFEGENITRLKSHKIAERGIVRTFQQRSLLLFLR